jgi:TRAP-type mannitol/chloroaromatic compound transport system substrate-binding protein
MKKKTMLTSVAVSIILSYTFIFVTSSSIAETIKWKMTTTWTPAIVNIHADRYFVKVANELCKDELEIQFFSGGEVVPPFEVFDAVRTNLVQAGADWPGYWAGKNTAFNILGALPAGPIQIDFLTWIQAGGGKDIYDEVYGTYGLKYLVHELLPAESGVRGHKTITTATDFKGAKIRMSGLFQGKILKDLQAAHVMLAGGEIYQALEKGVIDFGEFATPQHDWNLGFQDVTEVWNPPGWHQPASVCGIMVNAKAWNNLPKKIKRKLEIAADATLAWSLGYYNYQAGVYSKKFIDKGTQVNFIDEQTLDKIYEYSYDHILEEAKKNPLFAKTVYSLYQTIQNMSYWRDKEYPLWERSTRIIDMDKLHDIVVAHGEPAKTE